MKNLTHPDDAYGNATNDTFNVRRMYQNIKRINSKKQVKIEIEILKYTYGGTGIYKKKRIFVDTKQWVFPKNWNNKTQKLSKKENNYEIKKNIINQTYANVESYIASKGHQDIDEVYGEGVDYIKVREIFPSRKENRKTFYDHFINYLNVRKYDGDTASNTIKVIKTVTNRIKGFDEYRNKKTYMEDINFLWSDAFNMYCVGIKKYAPHTIHRTYQVISVCLEYYYRRRDEMQIEMTDKFKDPNFKYGKKSSNAPYSLTYDQREILYNHKCEKAYMEKARKMMCIQLFTGCRYDDIKLFTPNNFKLDGLLKFIPKKTKRYDIEVIQPLHPKAKIIFKEVDYDTTTSYTTSNQKYNDYCVEVFQELQIKYPDAKFNDDYSSHNYRDTFISIAVKKSVNFKSLLKWVGQKKYETLAVYIDLDDEFERQEMNKTV